MSWTDGGFSNYTGLSVQQFERFRGANAAVNILSYLAGSQQVLARRYRFVQAAFAHILPIPMAVAIGTLFLAGVIGCVCIPALPDGYPQRRFDLYSWVAAMEGDGLRMERKYLDEDRDLTAPLRPSGEDGDATWRPGMPMDEVEKEFGSLRMRMIVKL